MFPTESTISDFSWVLTLIKYCSVVVGTVAGITSVLLDYKDKKTGHLTFGGKAAIALIAVSLVISAMAQYLEGESQEQLNQKQLLAAIERQTQLIDTIRAGSAPLTDRFSVEIVFPLNENIAYTQPYFSRLRLALKDSGENPLFMNDGESFAPAADSEPELRRQLDDQKLPFSRSVDRNFETGPPYINSPFSGIMTVFPKEGEPLRCYLGKATYGYTGKYPAISINVHLRASIESIAQSSKAFMIFADLADKKIELEPCVLRGTVPAKLTLTSPGKQVIVSSEFILTGRSADYGRDSYIYSASLGKLN